MQGLRVTKNVKEIKFERVWDDLESRKSFQRQWLTKYLRLTLVFMLSLLVIFLSSLHNFVIFPNFRSLILQGKPYFLFPVLLKRLSFQKNCAGMWSFLYYRERWYFFLPKIWRWSFLKNTRKCDIFWKPSVKMVFAKRTAPVHDLSADIFFPKTWCFFPGQKVKDGLSQEIHGNMVHYTPAKKNRKPNI